MGLRDWEEASPDVPWFSSRDDSRKTEALGSSTPAGTWEKIWRGIRRRRELWQLYLSSQVRYDKVWTWWPRRARLLLDHLEAVGKGAAEAAKEENGWRSWMRKGLNCVMDCFICVNWLLAKTDPKDSFCSLQILVVLDVFCQSLIF